MSGLTTTSALKNLYCLVCNLPVTLEHWPPLLMGAAPLSQQVSTYNGLETFHQLDHRIKANLNTLEANNMEIKQNTFLTDTQDYISNTVYSWPKVNYNSSTPRSIRRKKKSRYNKPHASRVHFDSTD